MSNEINNDELIIEQEALVKSSEEQENLVKQNKKESKQKILNNIKVFKENKVTQIKNFVDNNIRFSIKSKLTLSYVFLFSFISTIFVFSLIFLFLKTNTVTSYESFFYLLFFILIFKGFEILINANLIYKLSKKALKPVDNMINEVNEISINNLEKRLDVSGVNNELKDLAKTFNKMLDEVNVSIENQKRFVSDASHELKTPISVIQGYINLLDRWGKEDKEILEESIKAIKDESQSMTKLIENLLFLARGESNKFVFEKKSFDLKNLIEEIVKETSMIDKKHKIETIKNEEIEIVGDKNLIKEAIRIFVDNSIKYTDEGGIIKINSFSGEKCVYIVIEDNGIGISKEDLEKIFDRFYRVDKSRSRESGGFGLGLSIAKYIIDTHGGEIKIYSKLNEGTIVSVMIPN